MSTESFNVSLIKKGGSKMDQDQLLQMLEEVSKGQLDVEQAYRKMKALPFEDLGFACVDTHRAIRNGFPEVIFGQGKNTEQIIAIAERIIKHGGPLLVTRVLGESADALVAKFPEGKYHQAARAFYWQSGPAKDLGRGEILVISAGTSDLPIAEEAALTAKLMGNRVTSRHDVGVAGIHRLLDKRQQLEEAEVIIVVAGMEGALPSVVKGLVDRPVIAVPTSVGYGASFGGVAALLGMLNSCASGVCVVNIDNGFGAGYAAALMNRRRELGGS
jgi:NCAIR mutase (PurE)-related protein